MHTVITRKDKTIRADYHGGAYIDLTFGSEGYNPTEVINVWDYQAGQPDPPFNQWDELKVATARAALRDAVDGWIQVNEEDGWTDWYEDYIRNAR